MNLFDDYSFEALPNQPLSNISQVGQRWEFPVSQTKNGNYWGTIEESRGGKRILAFRGIPYAKPPTGNFRYHNSLKKTI